MRIVMTGATSGIGLEAARHLLERDDVGLIAGARSPADAPAVLQNDKVTILPLDLADLGSVRTFAAALGDEPVDVLICNAGIQTSTLRRAANGIELTFVTNHLAHFLLIALLQERLAEHARVILTASGVHDPALRTPVTPPDHADAQMLAYPENDPQLPSETRAQVERAYSASKLCNILTARELARRQPGLNVLAFNPGFIPSTGLARENPEILQAFAGKLPPHMAGIVGSAEVSGRLLAELATDPAYARASGGYLAVQGDELRLATPSVLALDHVVARKLWEESAALLCT